MVDQTVLVTVRPGSANGLDLIWFRVGTLASHVSAELGFDGRGACCGAGASGVPCTFSRGCPSGGLTRIMFVVGHWCGRRISGKCRVGVLSSDFFRSFLLSTMSGRADAQTC